MMKNTNRKCFIWLKFFLIIILATGCTKEKLSNSTQKELDTATTESTKLQSSTSSLQTKTPSTNSQTNSQILATNPTTTTLKYGWHKDLKVDDVAYDLYVPVSYSKHQLVHSLLVLPGWNYPRTSWIENTSLIQYSDRFGYILILPEMGKTLYESAYYPETTMKWNAVAGGKFIKEKFIPTIQQKHGILKPGQYNTLLGLSTGGRGVALIALENPDLFVAGASLSGDFSQENTSSDRLMTGVYGSFSRFKSRWLGKDNPQTRVSEWKMPLYLAHGTADSIVPESQSRLFYNALINSHGNQITILYNPVPNAGHNYQFWGGQLPYVFQFFATVEKQQNSNSK